MEGLSRQSGHERDLTIHRAYVSSFDRLEALSVANGVCIRPECDENLLVNIGNGSVNVFWCACCRTEYWT